MVVAVARLLFLVLLLFLLLILFLLILLNLRRQLRRLLRQGGWRELLQHVICIGVLSW